MRTKGISSPAVAPAAVAAVPALNQYRVAPFSAANYQKNSAKLGASEYGCAICGKPVRLPYEHEATIVGGRAWAETLEEAKNEADPGFMGVWGIGPDCHKKHLVKPGANAAAAPAANLAPEKGADGG